MKVKITLRELIQIAMLIALAFVLERLTPIINLPTLRITLTFIPMMFCGMLFGPLWGGLAFGAADILGWPIMGLTPNPLILFARILAGVIYGLLLHREKPKIFPHAVLNSIATQYLCAACLTTWGLSMMWGTPYLELLLSRLPQFGIYIILEVAIFPVLLILRNALQKANLINI
ncbi:MAG: folate family ECF transporter S component [Oscillospiraceae bacterium]|nr:folate family ECF transporter S component [Oscillospiraceae bacterium]